MRGEREKDTDALMARYGIGRRLATRVVALQSRNVDVTGTILDEAGREESLARLLLDRQLVESPESVTEEYLRQQAEELGFPEADILRLVEDPETGWRTVALEDDLLAADAQEAEPGGEGLSLVRQRRGEISVSETEELFTPQEVAQLKLTVLTSQDPDERVENLRKLVFAPMEGSQKATVFVNVLTDREAAPRVRREAVRSLEQIGFRSDMAEAVRGLFTESPEDAVYAIQRLGALLRDAEEGEAALVLAVLLEVLDQNQDSDIVRELLALTTDCAALLVTNYEKTQQFVQSALRQLGRDFDGLRPDVQDALEACAREAPDLVGELLWTELQRTDNPRVRSLLVRLSEALAASRERLDELARQAVAQILDPELPESEKAGLRYALVRLGEPAAQVVLERMSDVGGARRAELIRLLDVLCTESEVSDAMVEDSVRSLIDLLKLADTLTRRSVVQTSVLVDERVSPGLRRELAEELLTLMGELNLPDTLDIIQNTLEQIGAEALGPAHRFMRTNYPSDAAERTCFILGSIMQDNPGAADAELAESLYALCADLLHDEANESGAFAMAMAGVCGYTDWGRDVFDESLEEIKDGLWKLPYSMDLLDALAVMAGSRNAEQRHQEELFELFDSLVQFQAGTGMGVRKETEEGTVYEFGREVQFDIRAVPAAVRGLERICVSPQASGDMRTRIVKRLLILWEGVSKVRIVWGPAAISALIEAMCSAACSPRASVQTRVRLGASLLRFLNKLRVIEGLGQICSRPDLAPEVQEMAVETGLEMLQEWSEADVQDVERRLALLKAAGRIAANTSLDPEEEDVQLLRQKTLSALFSGLRDGHEAVREPLQLLRDCPDVTDAQKREIDERMSKAFGLVRIGRED
ncbi:MAG: hypothetical protein R6X33_17370 [Candidatus Brocadiia bacterium]